MTIVAFKLNDNLFLRDPLLSNLGRKIIHSGIHLIDYMGFENFTFKKLASEITSTEASVYRYFENKHRLLLYLIELYWTWLGHKMDYRNQNIKDPVERLRNCIRLFVEEKTFDPETTFMECEKLQRIVHREFEKTYLTRQVDMDNRDGLFLPYKTICRNIGAIVREINPKYPFPNSLVSTIMLSANHQLFYARHLPELSDIKNDSKNRHTQLVKFLESTILNTIQA
jgi:AcrR family transcriptional regulator